MEKDSSNDFMACVKCGHKCQKYFCKVFADCKNEHHYCYLCACSDRLKHLNSCPKCCKSNKSNESNENYKTLGEIIIFICLVLTPSLLLGMVIYECVVSETENNIAGFLFLFFISLVFFILSLLTYIREVDPSRIFCCLSRK